MNTQTIIRIPLIVAGLGLLASCTIIEPPSSSYPPASSSRPQLPEVNPPVGQSGSVRTRPVPGVNTNPVRPDPVILAPKVEAEQASNPYDDVPQGGAVVVRSAAAEVGPSPGVVSPAVNALLAQAKVDIAANDNAAAMSKLERALRIEPRNAMVWHHLAKANYNAGNDSTAISMAKKSNLFIDENGPLEHMNWQLIKSASKRAGDIKTLKDALRYERNHPR